MEKKTVKTSSKMEVETGTDGNANGPKVVTSFRHSPDIENFYRFVHDHGLRKEARMVLEKVMAKLTKPKKRKKNKITH